MFLFDVYLKDLNRRYSHRDSSLLRKESVNTYYLSLIIYVMQMICV